MSYERKNIIFYEKNFKLTINNTFNNIFLNKIFLYYRILPICLHFRKEVKNIQISLLKTKKMFLFKKFFLRFQPLKNLFLKF